MYYPSYYPHFIVGLKKEYPHGFWIMLFRRSIISYISDISVFRICFLVKWPFDFDQMSSMCVCVQRGVPCLAKLVYEQLHYGLWMFMKVSA